MVVGPILTFFKASQFEDGAAVFTCFIAARWRSKIKIGIRDANSDHV